VLERLAEPLRDAVAELEGREHLGTADVEVAPLEACELVGLDAGLDLEGRRLAAVQYLGRVDDDLDLAGGHVGILGALGAATDGAA